MIIYLLPLEAIRHNRTCFPSVLITSQSPCDGRVDDGRVDGGRVDDGRVDDGRGDDDMALLQGWHLSSTSASLKQYLRFDDPDGCGRGCGPGCGCRGC